MARKKIDKAAEEERQNTAVGCFVVLLFIGGVLGIMLESWFIFGVFAVLGIYYMFKMALGTPKEDPASTSHSTHSTAPMMEYSITPEERLKPRPAPAVEQSEDDDEDEDDEDWDIEDEDISDTTFCTSIAGVTYHNEASDKGGFLGYVSSDPDNTYDPHAIAIYTREGRLVGYLPKNSTASFRQWSQKEHLPCIGYIAKGDYLFGRIKVVDADKETTKLEFAKEVAWLINRYGVKYVPDGFTINSPTPPRTANKWLDILYTYIDNRER